MEKSRKKFIIIFVIINILVIAAMAISIGIYYVLENNRIDIPPVARDRTVEKICRGSFWVFENPDIGVADVYQCAAASGKIFYKVLPSAFDYPYSYFDEQINFVMNCGGWGGSANETDECKDFEKKLICDYPQEDLCDKLYREANEDN